MISITSFGYLHGAPPEADRTEDLRRRYRDPARMDGLLDLNYDDPRVQRAVLGTSGIGGLISNLSAQARVHHHLGQDLVIAIGCAGGKHRGPVVAQELARLLAIHDVPCFLHHRDAHRPRVLKDR